MSNEFKMVPLRPTAEMIAAMQKPLSPADGGYVFDTAQKELVEAVIACIAAAPQPPALGGELKTLAWIYCEDQEKKIDWFVGALEEVPVNTALIDRAHYDAQQAEIERLTAENTALRAAGEICAGAIPHLDSARQERDQLKADLAERWEQIAELNSEAVQLKARCEDLGCLLLGWYTANCDGQIQVEDSAYHIVTATADALSKPAGSECCTPTDEERALLAAGDCTPEELWGGPHPTCPKCIKPMRGASV